jgi:hypothetical protein
MKIEIPNRLPPGLRLEMYHEHEEMKRVIQEEGLIQFVQNFYKHIRATLENDELMWEGYFADQPDGSTNLYVVGILYHNDLYYTRIMRVLEVSEAQLEETEAGMGDMMTDYLDRLLIELDRMIKPGKGKSHGGGWFSPGEDLGPFSTN